MNITVHPETVANFGRIIVSDQQGYMVRNGTLAGYTYSPRVASRSKRYPQIDLTELLSEICK